VTTLYATLDPVCDGHPLLDRPGPLTPPRLGVIEIVPAAPEKKIYSAVTAEPPNLFGVWKLVADIRTWAADWFSHQEVVKVGGGPSWELVGFPARRMHE